MRRNQVPDPSWKSGPPEPNHHHSEHAIDPEPAGYDFDGFGRDEMEEVDGEALVTIQEAYSCHRDGCDAMPRKRHLYTSLEASTWLHKACERAGHGGLDVEPTYNDEWSELAVEYFAMNATIVDYDHVPIVGVEFGEDTFGYVYPEVTKEDDFSGSCYGRSEPNPDVNAHRYDL